MARRLLEALLARQRAGNLSLQFTSAGQPVDHPPVIVPPSLPLPAANITCGDEHVIVAEICHRSGAASCLVREDGGTKLKKATFSTSSSLSTIINFLLGCPAVQLKVRNFVSDHPQAKPKYDCVIEQIVGPTEEWGVEPYVLDYLADCLAELRALMQPDVQSPLLE
jgi:hypothetical protein